MSKRALRNLMFIPIVMFSVAQIVKMTIEPTPLHVINAVVLLLVLITLLFVRRIGSAWPPLALFSVSSALQAIQFAKHEWLVWLLALCSFVFAILAVVEGIAALGRYRHKGEPPTGSRPDSREAIPN